VHLVRLNTRRAFARALKTLVEGKGPIFEWAAGWLVREGKVVIPFDALLQIRLSNHSPTPLGQKARYIGFLATPHGRIRDPHLLNIRDPLHLRS